MIYFFCPPQLTSLPPSWLASPSDPLESFVPFKEVEALTENKFIFSPTVLHMPTPDFSHFPLKSFPGSEPAKVFSLEKKKTFDEDYNPDCQVIKKNKKSKQLENRNVVPNIVRLVLSYVQKPGKSSKLVEKILKLKSNSRATVKRFFLFHKLVKTNIDNYVHEDTLAELVRPRPQHHDVYSPEEQQLYNSITRKLILHFLLHEAQNCVLTSKRMEQTKKQDHVAAIRGLIGRLKSTLSK